MKRPASERIVYVESDSFPQSGDTHLNNLIRQCREQLQQNKPVQAHMYLSDIAKYTASLNPET